MLSAGRTGNLLLAITLASFVAILAHTASTGARITNSLAKFFATDLADFAINHQVCYFTHDVTLPATALAASASARTACVGRSLVDADLLPLAQRVLDDFAQRVQ
jgi:hypothetical protein